MKWFSLKVLRTIPLRLFYAFLIGCLGAVIGMVIGLPLEWVIRGIFDSNFDAKWVVYPCFIIGFFAYLKSSLHDSHEV